MEFQFRAGEERSGRPPPSSKDAATTSAYSKPAGTHVQDSHEGHSTGYQRDNAEPVPPPASDPDELWRQAAKAMIRERILREEAEKLAELEAEVRRELIEERIPLFRSWMERPVRACALGSVTTPPPSGTQMQTQIELQARSKANMSVALPFKRKNPDVAVASAAMILTSSNKQKLNLTCTVCGIPATSEKALQDHLKGKVHMKKTAWLAQPTAGAGNEDDDEVHLKANPLAVLPEEQENPNIVTVTSSKTQKLDLTCKVCGVTSTSQKHMQAHLEGKIHKRKVTTFPQPTPEEVIANMVHLKANPLAVLAEEQENPNIVTVTSSKTQKLDLTCKVCGVTSASQKQMQAHLEGKIHKRKVTTFLQPMPEEVITNMAPSNANVPTDASILLAAASGKKQKLDLTCTVCGISVTSEKGMEDHLTGKAHMKKVAAVVSKEAVDVQEEKEEEGSYIPNKFHLGTNDGASHEVIQMNGSVFCGVCNVSTPDRVTMVCHLQGSKHISKARQKATTAATSTIAATVADDDSQTHLQDPQTATIAATVADDDPQTVAMRINGVLHTVRRVGGSLVCELCDVKVPSVSEGVMRSHLSGKMHTKRLKAVAAVDTEAAGKAGIISKDVALATNVDIKETRVEEALKDDSAGTMGGSELVEAKSKEPSLVGGTESHTEGNACLEKPAAGACAPESMASVEATVGYPTAMVVQQKADTDGNSSQMQEMESVETHGVAVVAADEEVKYQVEGKEFIVLRQLDGRLSCRLCGAHGCEKRYMINHIYAHLDK